MDGIRFDASLDAYFLQPEVEELILGSFTDFVDVSFWNELPTRMAQRDLLRMYDAEALALMTDQAIEEMLARLEMKYRSEFEQNGLKNMRIEQASRRS